MIRCLLESLEARRLLSAVAPSNDEQYLVELINRARANPVAEAALFGIDLDEGLAAGTISTAAKQPLAINPYLNDGAAAHSQYMLAVDQFDHDGIGDGTPSSRIAAAGYTVIPPGGSGENIAWTGTTGAAPAPTPTTAHLHQQLFVDTGITGRGHRTNMLYANYKEVGTGIESGNFTTNGYTYKSVMVSEEFAYSAGNNFLTGVAYTDAITRDKFYTVGEGLGGVAVSAKNLSTGATFTTTTWASGGYSLALPNGRYRVTATGGAINRLQRVVTLAGQNVKRDFTPGGADVGVVRGGRFYLDSNANHQLDAADTPFSFGWATDKPVVGDWNADGILDAGVYRDGIFYLDANGSGAWDAGDAAIPYGLAGDDPIIGDWNGDGRDDIGIHHGALFALDSDGSRSWNAADAPFWFGVAGDKPIAGDWNADGKTEIGIVHNAIFALDMNGSRVWDAGDRATGFGLATDQPVVGDFNRDGRADIGIRRGSVFALDKNGSGVWDSGDESFVFGLSTDLALSIL